MNAQSQPAPSMRVVRVKRKRSIDAPEDIVIQSLGKPTSSNTLSDALNGLEIAQSQINDATATLPRPKRFRKLVTLTAQQLAATDPDQLHKLHAATKPNQTKRPAESSSHHASLRYEQVRRRRGLTLFEITESAKDPLRGIDALYDIICTQDHTAMNDNNIRDIKKDDNKDTIHHPELLCNGMPMVRKVIAPKERMNDDARTLAVEKNIPEETSELDTNDGYLYDLYMEDIDHPSSSSTAVDHPHTDANTKNEENTDDDIWFDMHLRGTAPVVHIIDDDTWCVVEGSDVDDSDVDSDDQNAEGFYANSYPDEESSDEIFSSDGDDGFYYSGGGRSIKKKDWFDDSD